MIDAEEAREIIKTIYRYLPENFRNNFEVYGCSSWVGMISPRQLSFRIFFNDRYPNIVTYDEDKTIEEVIKTGLEVLGYKITHELNRAEKSYYFEKSGN